MYEAKWMLFALAISLASPCASSSTSVQTTAAGSDAEFSNPELVTIQGYSGTAQDPFITRDGQYLFWDSHTDVRGRGTLLYWAKLIDYKTFAYMGEIQGVNRGKFDGIPSMDDAGNFYFSTDRSYAQDYNTVWRGTFSNGTLTNLAPVEGISLKKRGWVNMDEEISPDGNTLYFSDNLFRHFIPVPKLSVFKIASKNPDGSFTRLSNTDDLMKNVNDGNLNYAPDISRDGLELFFTRTKTAWIIPIALSMQIYVARRNSTSEPFGVPQLIAEAGDQVEAPTLSPDGKRLYYHKLISRSEAKIYVLTRP